MKRVFEIENVSILAHASAVGREEKQGPLGKCFDYHDPTDRFGADTWEKAEGEMAGIALALALKRAGAEFQPQMLFAGDLQNQCVGTAYGLLHYGIPHVGLYGACSTLTEGLAVSSLLLDGGKVTRAAVVTSSHNAAAERQFRFPLEYGGQRTPTAQWTATASGAFLLEKGKKKGVCITRAMIGQMVDGGVKDAANMGAAMAPAAAESILTFFKETKTSSHDYDLIVTGDLGEEGSALLSILLEKEGVRLRNHTDCGCLLYDSRRQDAHAGASGCGCSAAVLSAHILPMLERKEKKKILFLSTGAIMSPSSIQQGESIYGIAPAVLLES